MKINLTSIAWGLALLLNGDLMAEQLPQNWITIQDEKTGLQADFPSKPLEMTFEVPFQNTPPTGEMHVYSVPIPSGVLMLSTFSSSLVHSEWLQKEHLYHFFETILVPHLFFDPTVFQQQQKFHYQTAEVKGKQGASFQISYLDGETMKKWKGIAIVKGHTLYTYFYLASEKDFDQAILERFVDSVYLPKSS